MKVSQFLFFFLFFVFVFRAVELKHFPPHLRNYNFRSTFVLLFMCVCVCIFFYISAHRVVFFKSGRNKRLKFRQEKVEEEEEEEEEKCCCSVSKKTTNST